MKKKSTYRILGEAMALGNLPSLPTNSLKYRKLQKEELTKIVKEEFGEAKNLADLKLKENPFASAEIAREMNWSKVLEFEKAFKK